MEVPTGAIFLWSGAIAAIPPGWVLCDGNNGTPDLRSCFVVGSGGAYNPGDFGGALTHVHTFTSDGHQHNLLSGATLAPGAVYSITTNNVVDTGTTDATNHLPPYFSLAYVMKT